MNYAVYYVPPLLLSSYLLPADLQKSSGTVPLNVQGYALKLYSVLRAAASGDPAANRLLAEIL
jgi:hypothetical protein